jgi:hypothetical protein
VPRILWWDSGSGLEARQRKARHGLLYSLFVSVGRLALALGSATGRRGAPARVEGGRRPTHRRWTPAHGRHPLAVEVSGSAAAARGR